MSRIYLDNAATTPLSPTVIEAMTEVMRTNFGNPSSIHDEGRRARVLIENARKTVAEAIGASIGEIFFTSGGTESNNTALRQSVRCLGVRRIITSPTEHHAVLHVLDALCKGGEVEQILLDVDERGRISYSQLEDVLQASSVPTLVSLMHANNEIGTMIDLDRVAEICAETKAYFHSDTVQTLGYFPIDVSRTQISFMNGAAHKFYGPKGVGFLYINGENIIDPLLLGGAQERNMRAGTENLYGIVGMAAALREATEQMAERRAHISRLRSYLMQGILEQIPGAQILGDYDGQYHYKTLAVRFPASPVADILQLKLDIAGISVSGGSACSSGADAGSHVFEAISKNATDKMIRFSFSHHNTMEELDTTLRTLRTALGVTAPVRQEVS